MSDSPLIAIDVAVLPPPDVSRLAVELSASLPAAESQGLRLGPTFPPHITLTQQFVTRDELDMVFDCINAVVSGLAPLRLGISGAGRSNGAVWMNVAPAPALAELHARLMDVLLRFEQPAGTAAAFVDGDARPRDVVWVTGYRRTASYQLFAPHITLGHAAAPPRVEPFSFDAVTVAACHLGRFCSCRRLLQRWALD